MSGRSIVSAAIAGAALVVSVGSVVTIASEQPRPRLVSGTSTSRPTTAATLACPGVSADPPLGSTAPSATSPVTAVSAVTPRQDVSSGASGRLEITGPVGQPLAAAGASGQLITSALGGTDHPSVASVAAHGVLAPGAQAVQTVVGSVPTDTPGKPPAKSPVKPPTPSGATTAAWCAAPRTDWWFAGADTSVDSTSTLVLDNPGPSIAVVGLSIAGPQGSIHAAGANAIALAPHTAMTFDLARWAPGLPDLALHISASRGTVSAAVLVQRVHGATAAGADWLPASAPPARAVVVGAGIAGTSVQTLIVANPGQRQLVVTATVLSASGAFTSTHLPPFQVPPGSVVERPLADVVLKASNAIELRANAPVTGAIESRLASGSRDFSLSGVAPALSPDPGEPTVVPLLPGSALTLAFAVVTKTPATVRIDGYTTQGDPVGSATLSLAGRSTTTWRPAAHPPQGSQPVAYYTVTIVRVGVTAGTPSGVSCIAQYTKADGLASLSLTPATWTVREPAVLP